MKSKQPTQSEDNAPETSPPNAILVLHTFRVGERSTNRLPHEPTRYYRTTHPPRPS
mgnify:CR=1 FL=1